MSENKSLIESVNEVKNARMSMTAKYNALSKLGLRPADIHTILFECRMKAREACEGVGAVSRPRMRMAFTFGVEIECDVDMTRVSELSRGTGFEFTHTYIYSGCHADTHTAFKFVPDGSVRGDHPIECVSPVLSGAKGKKGLKVCCDTLTAAGASVNQSCGLHVHIGAADLTDKQYANVFANYAYLESLIDSFMAPSRRNNFFAQRLPSSVKDCKSREAVCNAMHYERYYKVNCLAYGRHKTIEFRQHQGSTNFNKIYNWVMFCGRLVEWSKTNRLTRDITEIDDIPFLTVKEKSFFKARKARFAAH